MNYVLTHDELAALRDFTQIIDSTNVIWQKQGKLWFSELLIKPTDTQDIMLRGPLRLL